MMKFDAAMLFKISILLYLSNPNKLIGVDLHLQIQFGHLIGSSKYHPLYSISAVLDALDSSVYHFLGGTKDYPI